MVRQPGVALALEVHPIKLGTLLLTDIPGTHWTCLHGAITDNLSLLGFSLGGGLCVCVRVHACTCVLQVR